MELDVIGGRTRKRGEAEARAWGFVEGYAQTDLADGCRACWGCSDSNASHRTAGVHRHLNVARRQMPCDGLPGSIGFFHAASRRADWKNCEMLGAFPTKRASVEAVTLLCRISTTANLPNIRGFVKSSRTANGDDRG
jgi:hypothetical protein